MYLFLFLYFFVYINLYLYIYRPNFLIYLIFSRKKDASRLFNFSLLF